MITTFLFDLDDTIVDGEIYAEMYAEILEMIKSKGIDLNQEVKKLGLKKNKFSRWDSGDLCRRLNLLEEYYQILEPRLKTIPSLRTEIVPILKELKGKKIGIVSNSMERTIKLYLKKYQLENYFNFIFSFENSEQMKNHQQCWQELIEKENLNPQECLVIGDDPIEDGEIPASLGFKTLIINNDQDLKGIIRFL
tara:strand:- start:195 stop:776 length:582 start_codon:yes stop_codon:yes gene_type:complete